MISKIIRLKFYLLSLFSNLIIENKAYIPAAKKLKAAIIAKTDTISIIIRFG